MPPCTHIQPNNIYMINVAKYAWLLFLGFLFLGYWVFVIVALEIVAYLIVYYLSPKWLRV